MAKKTEKTEKTEAKGKTAERPPRCRPITAPSFTRSTGRSTAMS